MKYLMPAIAALVALGAIAFHPSTDPYSQRAFPCHEDEALMYAPQFGPDKVGCVNVEDIR